MRRGHIFLSYGREDQTQVQAVFLRLKDAGFAPWMDAPPPPHQTEGIPPGVDWDDYIRERLREAAIVLMFLSSRSIPQEGYRYREWRLAVSQLADKPQGSVYLIPVLLDECQPPALKADAVNLQEVQWYELHKRGVDDLIAYLRIAVPPEDHVTAEHLALIHSTWRAPKHDARFAPYRVHRVDVVLSAAETILDRVEHVTYYLPPAWPPESSPKQITDRRTGFGLQELAWGDCLVRARVKVKNQNEPIALSGFVRLTEHGPRLIHRT